VRADWRTDASGLLHHSGYTRTKPANIRDDNANRRIEMTGNTTSSTRRVAAGAVTQHDCADYGCLAAMLGLALDEVTAGNAEEVVRA
jgi:hypothetical protein